jgi:hypothetical protein
MSSLEQNRPFLRAEAPSHDLTNLKLAQNQTELSTQIAELRATVEAQGLMMKRLLENLEESSKGKQRERDVQSWHAAVRLLRNLFESQAAGNMHIFGLGFFLLIDTSLFDSKEGLGPIALLDNLLIAKTEIPRTCRLGVKVSRPFGAAGLNPSLANVWACSVRGKQASIRTPPGYNDYWSAARKQECMGEGRMNTKK